ncbi:MAG: tetratricopeptide repeat protein [Bacteroidales bacterium]|nr:tetratricopeptide repeat protein [Bacteroidales bacterium]MDD4670464.1 tetratricopeptide repeat protein [Bacteroidales bacterium]
MLYSQIAEDKFTDRLESARKLFNSGTYYAAEQAFNELSESIDDIHSFKKSEIEAYKVLCAIALDRVNIDGLVKVFETNYPAAPELAIVKFTLATHFFDKGDYTNALTVFKTLQPEHLYRSQESEFLFKYSYCNMRVGNYKESTSGFKTIIDSEFSQYTYPSIYYLGYVYYLDKNFKEAYPLFERALKDSRFTLMSSYYAVESKFMLKDYDYVIEHGPSIYDSLERDLQTYLARIVSEAYFAKNLPDMAQKYFDQYTKSGAQLSRKDHYYSGILSYTLKSYLSAIASFEHVLGINDTLSQNAYYYTANSYLMTKNKIAAMSAFKIASENDFDPVIKEDAMFNFAKLSFDVNSDISQFQRYLELYPKSGKDDVINNYMAAAFLLRKDYGSAVTALSKIKNLSSESSSNLQKAAFFRAMQLIENKGYRSAIPMLELSIGNGLNNEPLNNLAKYWLAECNYRNDKFMQAASINSLLVADQAFARSKEYPNAIYNLAYCYFKSENFEKSQEWFDKYLEGPFSDKRFEKDARVRLGDSYFMQKQYEEAAPVYEEVFTRYYTSDDIYPAFQSAVSYGLLGNDTKKISILKRVVKNNKDATLYPKALFELGRTYVQKGDDDNASECFYTLLGRKADSTYFSKSLLELAMINSNNGKYDKAIELYKEIIEDIPYAAEVQDAISGMESIYQTLNRPEDFLSYLDELGLSSIKTADEKELMRFNAAEQIYLSGNYPAAMNSLQSFISAYPAGAKSAQAYLYLAESLKATGRKEAAADAYMQVMKMGEGSLAENATNNYAKISYDLEHYSRAIDAYQTLSYIAKTDEMKNIAFAGRMRSYYGNKQYSNALKDAQRIVNSSGISDEDIREAKYIMAKSYLVLGDRDLAKPVFEDLASDYNDAIGAESAYILILDAYDAGDFPNVEKRVYAFSDAGTRQVYWLAKSFIVLGDSFADREEWEQAKATFESVLKGYKSSSDGDDVYDQVKMRINRIKSLEKAK